MDMTTYTRSKFLGAADYPRPAILTIEQVSEEAIGEDKKIKSILYFQGVERPLVLNKTNIAFLIEMLGTAESDQWVGQKIEIYADPNVMYAGKRMPSLRVRMPQQRAATPQRPGPQAAPQPQANPTNLVTDETEIPDPGPVMNAQQRAAYERQNKAPF